LRPAVREIAYGGVYVCNPLSRVGRAALRKEIKQALLSELARVAVFRFCDAISVKKQEVAGAHGGAAHLDPQLFKHTDGQAAGRQLFDSAACAPKQRRKVAATAIFDLAGPRIERGV